MQFHIDKKELEKKKLPLSTALYLVSLYFNNEIKIDVVKESLARGFLVCSTFDANGFPIGAKITNLGVQYVEDVFINSEIHTTKEENFENIAQNLRELFPKGRKPGTSLMWRGSEYEVVKKLKTLKKKLGKFFTEEEIINAAKRYIQSFNGNYTYMRTLPYFILKQEAINGVVEEKSELLSYIENSDGDNTTNSEWTAELR